MTYPCQKWGTSYCPEKIYMIQLVSTNTFWFKHLVDSDKLMGMLQSSPEPSKLKLMKNKRKSCSKLAVVLKTGSPVSPLLLYYPGHYFYERAIYCPKHFTKIRFLRRPFEVRSTAGFFEIG